MKNKCGRCKSLKISYLMQRNPLCRKEPDSNCFLRVNEMKHIRNSVFQSNTIRKYYTGIGSLQDKLVSLKSFLCACERWWLWPKYNNIFPVSYTVYVFYHCFLPLLMPPRRRVWKVLGICSPNTIWTTCTSTFSSGLCVT